MARQILLKKYEKEINEKEERKEEIQKEKKNNNLGFERLGPLVTSNYFKKVIQESAKYKKIEKQTLKKLISQIDKRLIADTIDSLKKFNENKVGEKIHLNLEFE